MERDTVALLIPWYANGTLGAEERRTVEGHLPGCQDCRALLDQARAFSAYGRTHAIEELARHVQTRLLMEFAEDPASIEPDTAEWIRFHFAACSVCRDAHAALASLPDRPETRNPLRVLWHLLAGSVLHPAAAIVYLTALLLAYPVSRLLVAPQPEAGATKSVVRVLPPAVAVYGETSFRGLHRTPGEVASPLELELSGAAGGDLLLELHTDVDPEDLRQPGAVFALLLLDGERVVWSEKKRGDEFEPGGVLRVLLSADGLVEGRDCVLVLRMEKPGAPPEEGVVFRKTIRVSRFAPKRSSADR